MEYVKIKNHWKGLFFVILKEIFQKLQDFWVAKAPIIPYILCKILRFQTQITEKVFATSGSNI